MVEQLEILAASPHSWARERAAVALEMYRAHQAGGISDEEYAELMQDLVRSDVLDTVANDLETKAMLVTAVYAAANLI